MAFGNVLRTMFKQEVDASDVDAALRMTGQLEEIRRRIEQGRLDGELRHPGRPWETYAELGPALASFWAAQALVALGRALREATAGGGTGATMPRVSHDQAIAALNQAATFLQRSNAALYGGGNETDRVRPVLPTRVESRGRCPTAHLKGMLRAAQYLDEQAQVETQTYTTAVAGAEAPEAVRDAAKRVATESNSAQFALRMTEQAVFPILQGEAVSDNTHEDAENRLWSCLETYTLLGQLIAMPEMLNIPPVRQAGQVSESRRSGLIESLARYALEEYSHGHHHGHHDHHDYGRHHGSHDEWDEYGHHGHHDHHGGHHGHHH